MELIVYLFPRQYTRNMLIHRPDEIRIDNQKSLNYINDVEAAIGHLISLLYPDYYKKSLFVDHYS